MFTKSEKKHTYVDDLITNMVLEIQKHEPDSKEYDECLDRLTQLQKIRNEERNAYLSDLPSADTILTVAANLIGIALIINYERLNVITSAALPFVKKP